MAAFRCGSWVGRNVSYMGRDNEHKIYKAKWACFRCRKCFKQRSWHDLSQSEQTSFRGRIVHCPQCRNAMVNMGWDFKVPRQSNLEQWRKVELLAQHGYLYHAPEHAMDLQAGPGPRPARLREVVEFLKAVEKRSHAREK